MGEQYDAGIGQSFTRKCLELDTRKLTYTPAV